MTYAGVSVSGKDVLIMIKQYGQKLLNILVNPHVFALVYLIALTLRSVYFFLDYADIVCKGCFIWGCFIIAYDVLFGQKNVFRAFRWYLLVAFTLLFGITIIVNIRYSFFDSVKNMIYCLLFFFVLYTQRQDISKEELYRYLKRYNHIMVVLITCITTVSVLFFILNINFLFEAGGALRNIGFWYNRLYGVWNPNTGTMLGLASILFCGINYYISDRKPGRWWILYIYNLIIQFIYYSLSNSRAMTACIAVMIAVVLVFIAFPHLRTRKKMWISLVLTVAIGATSMGAVLALTTGTRTVMRLVPPLLAPLTEKIDIPESPDIPLDDADDEISFERVENFEENGDITNNRMGMWKAAWKIVKQHPIFGIGDPDCLHDDGTLDGNIDASVFTEEDYAALKHAGYFFHNGFIQILLTSGFAGLIVFLLLMASVAYRYLAYLFKSFKSRSKDYKVIALIFTVLAYIVVDDFAEVHFLFSGPDTISVIFWYLAGTGLLLIKAEDAKANTGDGARFALAADTPFQTMNCCNFVLQNTDDSAGKADLYLYHQFRDSHEISERIKQSGVFCNVYDLEPYKTYSPFVQKLVTLYRLFLPQRAIQGACTEKLRLSRKRYQKLCISFPTPFTLGLHWAFPNAQVYHLEDGLGSYGGNITVDYSSKLYQLINRFLYNGALDLHPSACYLSAPAFSQNTIGGETRKLPSLAASPALGTVQKIFDYHVNDIYKDRIVYLTQPLGERSIYRPEWEKRVLEMLKNELADRVVVRLHPRQKDLDTEGLEKDTYGNLWELECVHQITDTNVLISAFSTAQFMPKIMADAEPMLIFTYRLLFDSLDDPFLKDFAALIDDFRKLYRASDRIYVPETFEELETIFEKLKRGGADAS